jgi:hypothetical protein
MATHGTEAAVLFAVSAAAGAAFAGMAAASAARKTVRADNHLHATMRRTVKGAAREKARAAASPMDKVGKWWAYTPVALVSAAVVFTASPPARRGRRGRRIGALTLLVVPAVARATSKSLDRWLPQPRVGRRSRPTGHPVFPSGHALGVSAVAFTTGYVVVREGLARPRIVLPAAALAPVVVGLGRLVREKHLASDTLGGWLAGAAIAALHAGAYEMARDD